MTRVSALDASTGEQITMLIATARDELDRAQTSLLLTHKAAAYTQLTRAMQAIEKARERLQR